MRPVEVEFSFPPSANRLWRSRVSKSGKPSVYRDPAYKRWVDECCWLVAAMKPRPKVVGPFTARIVLASRKGRVDIDNRIKPVLDALQHARVIDDDSKAVRVEVVWGDAPKGCRVVLTPVTPVVAARMREVA